MIAFFCIILFFLVVALKYSYYRDLERAAVQRERARLQTAEQPLVEHSLPHRGWWNRVLRG
jgi:hypothetical protein